MVNRRWAGKNTKGRGAEYLHPRPRPPSLLGWGSVADHLNPNWVNAVMDRKGTWKPFSLVISQRFKVFFVGGGGSPEAWKDLSNLLRAWGMEFKDAVKVEVRATSQVRWEGVGCQGPCVGREGGTRWRKGGKERWGLSDRKQGAVTAKLLGVAG